MTVVISSLDGRRVLQFPERRRNAAKSPDAVDCHVGARIRRQRLLAGLGQEELGEALGVTPQQVQKYENGTSRVGVGQLAIIAKILSVQISFFFAGQVMTKGKRHTASDVKALLATRDGIAMARAFVRIGNASLRQALIAMAEAAAKED